MSRKIPPGLSHDAQDSLEAIAKDRKVGWKALVVCLFSRREFESTGEVRVGEDGRKNSVLSPSQRAVRIIMHEISSRSQNAHCSRGCMCACVCGRDR